MGNPEFRAVLVIEDDPVCAKHTCNVLRQANFTPTVAASLTEATFFTRLNFVAIFLDLLLPETTYSTMNDAVIIVRRYFPTTPIIVLSAYTPALCAMELLRRGADLCLRKPLKLECAEDVVSTATEINRGHMHQIRRRIEAAVA